jgi:hypothetical protein
VRVIERVYAGTIATHRNDRRTVGIEHDGCFSVALPRAGCAAPGTTVQQVIQPDTIVLSKPTTGRIIGSGYPPQGDTSVQGNFISFTGPDGIARGVFDGPATNGWTQELCDLGR